jgi:transcriptional antiterminator RfaH
MTRAGFLWVTETMFPRYLFARFTLAEMHRRVRHTLGISGIVQFGDHYPTIEDRALAHLRDHTGGEIKELDYELSKGNQVKIVSGAFVGLEAVITHVLPAKRRVIILMDFLGRKVEAELECSCIAPQQNRLLAEVSTPDPLYEQSGYTPIAHL